MLIVTQMLIFLDNLQSLPALYLNGKLSMNLEKKSDYFESIFTHHGKRELGRSGNRSAGALAHPGPSPNTRQTLVEISTEDGKYFPKEKSLCDAIPLDQTPKLFRYPQKIALKIYIKDYIE